MAHTPNRDWNEDPEERDRRQRRERDYPSEFGNYPRRPHRWEEERGPRSFQNGGEYVGRGPKNYRRSDERIQDDACDRLTQDPHVDASEIEVSVEHGEITLEGTVSERHMKRMAEDCVESVPGARQVHNRLRVERS